MPTAAARNRRAADTAPAAGRRQAVGTTLAAGKVQEVGILLEEEMTPVVRS